ncbi:unnamed protein product, partial [Soboliphyme baturini]|uniref:Uncharacterized protein n=1 Tax=Soboliphyme baturini TaxID=241478 RepID=A0A183IAR3_9BILA
MSVGYCLTPCSTPTDLQGDYATEKAQVGHKRLPAPVIQPSKPTEQQCDRPGVGLTEFLTVFVFVFSSRRLRRRSGGWSSGVSSRSSVVGRARVQIEPAMAKMEIRIKYCFCCDLTIATILIAVYCVVSAVRAASSLLVHSMSSASTPHTDLCVPSTPGHSLSFYVHFSVELLMCARKPVIVTIAAVVDASSFLQLACPFNAQRAAYSTPKTSPPI